MRNIPLDAIPDLSDTQVIIYSRWDRSPDIIEDQVTYPIVSALLGAPKVKAIRGFSDFGYSYVYVIFEDGTDLYWARSRVLEYLSKILARLPAGVQTELGPDATSVGWVYQYALVDRSGKHDLAELRSLQDWYLRYHLQAVPGVSEVAAVGGFVKQYQVNVDPDLLLAYKIPLPDVIDAVRKGNDEVGGRLLELAGTEYMVRGRGYLKSVDDIEKIVVAVDPTSGTPVLVKNVAKVSLGPDIRRGVADLDGLGDTVGGIVVMRHGENALARHPARQSDDRGAPPDAAGGRRRRHHLRSLLAHRALDRHAAARPRGRDDHRQRGDPRLPVALPVGDHSDRHHPGLGLPGVHPALLHGDDVQHHVARRDRDLDRRPRRRRDRRGRERVQAPRAVDRGRTAAATFTPCACRR